LVDVVEISAGDFHSMARLSDGSVITWGADWHGQSTVPSLIDDAVSISAGGGHSLVLRCSSPFPSVDGTVRQVTGKPNQVLSFTPSISGNTETTAASSLPLGTEINAVTGAISGTPIVGHDQLIHIAVRNQVGYSYSPLRLFIGPYITGWGSRLPSGMPAGLTDIVELAAGEDHCLALLKDGTVVAWGNDYYGKATVPSDLDTVVAIAAGSTFSLALKENGEVIAWGIDENYYNGFTNPIVTNAVEIDAKGSSAHALCHDGTYNQIVGETYRFYSNAQNVYAISSIYADRYSWDTYALSIDRDGDILHSGNYSGAAANSTGTFDQVSASIAGRNYYSPDETQAYWGILRGGHLYEFSWSRYSSNEYSSLYRSEGGTVINVKGATGHALVLTNAFTIQSVQTAITPQDPWYYYDNQLDSTATLPGGLVNIGAFDVGPDYAIAIKEPFERSRITSLRVADGRAGQAFQYQATATPPIDEFRVTGLPAGLTIDPTTGIISGVPSEVGIFNCLIIAENADGFDTSVLSFKVTEGAPPYNISLSNNTISEGLPIDTEVSMLSALDPDTEDTHTYRLVTGDGAGDNSSFQISGTTLQTRKILDFETTAKLSIRIEATDLGGNTFSRVFEISLINVDTDDDDQDGLTEAEETQLGTDPLLRDSDLDGANDGTEVYGGSNPLKSSEKPLSYVAAWGRNTDGQCNVPIDLGPAIGIAVGEYHTLAIKADGTVAAWGRNTNGQCDVPAGLHSVVALAAGYNHSLALKKDGSVVAWGSSSNSLNTVPSGLNNVVEIAASHYNNFALKSDGTVVAWGSSSYDLNTAPESAVNAVAIAAGDYQMLTLNSDGSSSGWGQESYGEVTGPQAHSDLVAIAAGDNITLALNSDNKLMIWAWTGYELNELPTGLGEIRSIAAGSYLGLVVETDGSLTVWGSTSDGKTTVPPGLGNVIMADAGYGHVVALVDADGFVPSTSLYTISATAGLPMYEDISLWDSADDIGVTFLPQGISHDPITGEINGTPTETGNFLARVTAQKAFAQSTILLPIEIHYARRLSDWENVYFNAIEQANGHSGDLADIDLDNLPNLLEYALHRDPKSPDSSATTTSSLNSINQQDYLTLTYERLKGASDIRYIVEVSSDLINWNSGTDHTTRVQTINNAETEIISVRDLTPISTEIKRFMRLRVESIY
jgi:alpha-tubulin suppressor-like RCC1 family protein